MALLRHQKPVDGVPDPGRSPSSYITAQAIAEGKAVGTADWVQTGEIFRGK